MCAMHAKGKVQGICYQTAYLIFQPSSSWSSLCASEPLMPTTTSLLMVLSEQTGGVPDSDAKGPIATSKGVVGGA